MSEEIRYCVRGCTELVKDEESGERVGERPKLATEGYLCGACSKKLHGWLLEIPDLIADLDTRVEKGDPYSPMRRGKISGSPALIRLEVAAMLDPRSVTMPKLFMGDAYNPPEKATQPQDIRFGGDVPGVLEQWADCLCDDLNLFADHPENRPKGLVPSVDLLTGTWWSNVVWRPWIDELFAEIHEIRGILRRLADVRDPMPVGTCQCGQKLFLPDKGSTQIQCKHCGHRIDGLAVVRLKAAQTISEAEAS